MRLFGKRARAKKAISAAQPQEDLPVPVEAMPVVTDVARDERKRLFLKGFIAVVGGIFVSSLFPKRADALVLGSTPSSSIVGVKNAANARINPATEESLAALILGNSIQKKTLVLSGSGIVHTPGSGNKIRLYNSKFSLDTTLTSVSFRYTSGGTDFEKYLAPRTGGLYGMNNHPNYKEGGVDEALYCVISGSGNVQINIDYLEV